MKDLIAFICHNRISPHILRKCKKVNQFLKEFPFLFNEVQMLILLRIFLKRLDN